MIPYFILLAFIIILACLQDQFPKLSIFNIVACILLAIFGGIRYGVGTDFYNYEEIFSTLKNTGVAYTEIGFNTMANLVFSLGFSIQVAFLLSSFIICYCFYRYIKDNSIHPGLSYFIFFSFPIFYLASFNGIRQFIAVAIFIYAIKFIKSKSFIKYMVVITIAVSFHKTAIVLYPMYFILNKKIPLYLWGIGFVSLIALSKILPDILTQIGVNHKYTEVGYYQNTGFNLKSLFIFAILFIVILIRKTISKYSNDINIYINMLGAVCAISLVPIFINIPSAPVIRMSSYFSPVAIIVLGSMPTYLQHFNLNKNISYLILLSVFSVYFAVTIVSSGDRYNLVPYNFNLL